MKLMSVAALAATAIWVASAAEAQVVGPYAARDTAGRGFTFYVVKDPQTGNLQVKNLSVAVDAGNCEQEGVVDPLTLDQYNPVAIVDGRAKITFNFSTYYGEVEMTFDDTNGHAARGHLFAVGTMFNPTFQAAAPWRSQVCKSGKIKFEADGPP